MNKLTTSLSTSLDDIIKQNKQPQFIQSRRIKQPFRFQQKRPKQFNDRIIRVQQKQIQKPFQRSFRKKQEDSQPSKIYQQPQSSGKKLYTKKFLEQQQMPLEDENISLQIAKLEEQELQTRKQKRTKIIIENLNKKISNDDLREIFENAGQLIKFGIIWDILGRSEGWAEAEYLTEEGAANAIEDFDKAVIDGQEISVKYDFDSD